MPLPSVFSDIRYQYQTGDSGLTGIPECRLVLNPPGAIVYSDARAEWYSDDTQQPGGFSRWFNTPGAGLGGSKVWFATDDVAVTCSTHRLTDWAFSGYVKKPLLIITKDHLATCNCWHNADLISILQGGICAF